MTVMAAFFASVSLSPLIEADISSTNTTSRGVEAVLDTKYGLEKKKNCTLQAAFNPLTGCTGRLNLFKLKPKIKIKKPIEIVKR
jgi:hypothetical protein